MIWGYDQAGCLAAEPLEGMRSICPDEHAVLALVLVILAFFVVVMWHLVPGTIHEYRRRKRRREMGLPDDDPW